MLTPSQVNRRRLVAAALSGLVLAAAVTSFTGWRQLERASATSIGYTSEAPERGGLQLDLYDTLSSVGFFRSKSADLTRGLTSVDDRLEALMLWTNENVRPHYAAPDRAVAANLTWDIARRGFGECDQVNHVLATLATFAASRHGCDSSGRRRLTPPRRTPSPRSR